MAFEVSGILEWAWAILEFTIQRVYLFCLIIFFGILVAGLSDTISTILQKMISKMKSRRGSKRQRG